MSIEIILDWWPSSQTTGRQTWVYEDELNRYNAHPSTLPLSLPTSLESSSQPLSALGLLRALGCAGPMHTVDPTSLEQHQSFVYRVA